MNVFVPFIITEYNCTKTQADTAAIVAPSATSLMAGELQCIPLINKHFQALWPPSYTI